MVITVVGRMADDPQSLEMRFLTPEQLYQVYAHDRLVIHTLPLAGVPERPQRLSDKARLMCGSMLFHGGLHVPVPCGAGGQPCTLHLKNAVSRLGPPGEAIQTVLGTLHDLDLVWATHEQLEAAKPQGTRGQAFVFFSHCDMCDVANARGGQPAPSYLDTRYGVTPPTDMQRTRGFEFRAHCEGRGPSAGSPDDPRKPLPHHEWNELRAALGYDNLVGLCLLHDPAHDPQQHLAAAQELRRRVLEGGAGEGEQGEALVTCVFALDAPGSFTGELVVEEEVGEGEEGRSGGQGAGRVVPLDEYVARWERRS